VLGLASGGYSWI